MPEATPRLQLPDGSTWPEPDCPALAESMWKARWNMRALTQDDCYRILAVAEAYQHLAAHPAGTESVVAKLRSLRRVRRESRK